MNSSPQNRRKNPRIDKNFCLKYCIKEEGKSPQYDISQIKDISQGGVRFYTSFVIKKDTRLSVELHVPYVDESLALEGVVVGCEEKVANAIYEARLKFVNVGMQVRNVLELIEKKFAKGVE